MTLEIKTAKNIINEIHKDYEVYFNKEWISKESYDEEKRKFLRHILYKINRTLNKENYDKTKNSLKIMIMYYNKKLKEMEK